MSHRADHLPAPPDAPERGERALKWAAAHLGDRDRALFARRPLIDPLLPNTSDIDLLAFAEVPDLLPERLWAPEPLPPVDVIWLPVSRLEALEELATWGLIAHRLAESSPTSPEGGEPSPAAGGAPAALRALMSSPESRAARIGGFLEMGFATVREIGITWDFPALALFWLQIAWSSLVASAADAAGQRVPNVYTRPLDALETLAEADRRLLEPFLEALALAEVDAGAVAEAVRRIHAQVTAAFPEPPWPDGYRQDTRYEYRYYSDPRELRWRLAVAEEMVSGGDPRGAALYLRFWAYSLARIPMVHRRCEEEVEVPFGRPFKAMGPELRALCPAILPDVTLALGGTQIDRAHVEAAASRLSQMQGALVASTQARDIPLESPRPWRPWRPEDARRPQRPGRRPSARGENPDPGGDP